MPTNKMSTAVMNRSCGDCTACCEGWHSANIEGHDMYPGRPCHFFCKQCTIYEFRPPTCREYYCSWMLDDRKAFPEWFRPDISGVIMTHRDWEGGSYLEVRETDKKITSLPSPNKNLNTDTTTTTPETKRDPQSSQLKKFNGNFK